MVFTHRWPANLEERFAAEDLPLSIIGHDKEAAFKLDDLRNCAVIKLSGLRQFLACGDWRSHLTSLAQNEIDSGFFAIIP